MPSIKSDIRLIDGDVISAVKAIKEYLPTIGYKFGSEDLKENHTTIKARINQQSFVKLYITNAPQIVHFCLKKKSEETIRIDTKCYLFPKFRIFYFSFLISLLVCMNAVLFFGSGIFLASSSMTSWGSYLSSSFDVLMSVFFFTAACFFYMRSISTFPYENFMNQLYDFLSKKGFENKGEINIGHSFQDMWKALFFIGTFSLPISALLIFDIVTNEQTVITYFLSGAIIVVGLLSVLLVKMNSNPTLKSKMFFALVGFSSSMPVVIHFASPLMLSVTGDLNNFFQTCISNGRPQEIIRYGAFFYIGSFCALILLATSYLINLLQLPIRIVTQIDKSSAMNHNSFFYKSLESKDSFFLFSLLLILLWATFWVVKIIGLYFALTILERSIFNSSHFFESTIAILFFDNIKTSLSFLLSQKFDSNFIFIIHRAVMALYGAPMILLVFFIVKKNIKSAIKDFYLIVKKSEDHEKIEKELSMRIEKICSYADVRVPIVRVTPSKNINSKVKFSGFPLFRNILMISIGAVSELNDKKGELDILLAHEIGHIKKHTLVRKILGVLSDYSFFGNGFLALLQNSFKIEREADEFAVGWFNERRQDENEPIDLLKSLLERIEEIRWENDIFRSDHALDFSMFKGSSRRHEFLDYFNKSSKFERVKINLRLLFQLYFGEEIQSYFHPSNSQRINWIEEIYGTN